MIKCSRCQFEKPESEFSKNKTRSNGLSNVCKVCSKEVSQKWREQNKYDGRIVANKKCSTCKTIKNFTEFFYDKAQKDGLSTKCKECILQYRKENREDMLEKQKARNKARAEKEKIHVTGRVCSQCKEYKPSSEFWKSKHTVDGLYPCCKVCKKQLESIPQRKENHRKCVCNWISENKEMVQKYQNEWDKKKRKEDVGYRLRRNTMHAIMASIRGCKFDAKTERLKKAIFDHLPYTSDDLIKHIESKWESWMGWDNYGKYDPAKKTWQIDHIIPQSKLKFSSFDDENFRKLWDLSNLQPLETIANIKKSNRIIDVQVSKVNVFKSNSVPGSTGSQADPRAYSQCL